MTARDWQLWLYAMLKGGVRKSTSTMGTAFALAAAGRDDVLVIDADSRTQGVTDWASRVYAAGGELPFHVAQWSQSLGLLVPFVQAQVKLTGARLVLVDGGEAPEVIRQALHLSTLVVCPVGPDQAELGRIGPTAEVVRPSGTPMHVLLTRVPRPGRGVAAEVRRALVADGYDVLATEIPQQRELYTHVWGTVPADRGAYDELAVELLALSKAAAA